MRIVKFKKPWRAYNSGEKAGFEDDVATVLVEAKVAEYHVEPPGVKPPKSKKDEE